MAVWILAAIAAPILLQTPPQASGTQIAAQIRALASAVAARDAAALEPLVAHDFVMRGDPDLTRAAWIGNALQRCWGGLAVDDVRVRAISADTAIATYVMTANQDPSTCAPATLRSIVTDLWRLDEGAWRLASRHASAGGSVQRQYAVAAAPPPTLEARAELSFVGTGGNTDTRTMGTAADVSWTRGAWKSEARAAFIRAEAAGVVTARSTTARVRQGWVMSPRLEVFGRAEYARDLFAGIDARVTLDAGLGWTAAAGPRHTLRLDGSAGYLREQRVADADVRSAVIQATGKYRWAIGRTTAITDEAQLIVPLEDAAGWRHANTLSLSAGLSRLLSLKVSYAYTYLHEPVPGFRATDTVVSAALVASIAR